MLALYSGYQISGEKNEDLEDVLVIKQTTIAFNASHTIHVKRDEIEYSSLDGPIPLNDHILVWYVYIHTKRETIFNKTFKSVIPIEFNNKTLAEHFFKSLQRGYGSFEPVQETSTIKQTSTPRDPSRYPSRYPSRTRYPYHYPHHYPPLYETQYQTWNMPRSEAHYPSDYHHCYMSPQRDNSGRVVKATPVRRARNPFIPTSNEYVSDVHSTESESDSDMPPLVPQEGPLVPQEGPLVPQEGPLVPQKG